MASKIIYKAVPQSNTDSADSDDSDDLMLARRRRSYCSCIPCLGSYPASPDGSWERIRHDYEGPWWSRGWKRICKLVAGPKWKTFVRRFNKRGGGKRSPKLNYDAMSYALNFDEGPEKNGNLDEDYLYMDFSCRYASIPASAKSSMDWGKDAPSFTRDSRGDEIGRDRETLCA